MNNCVFIEVMSIFNNNFNIHRRKKDSCVQRINLFTGKNVLGHPYSAVIFIISYLRALFSHAMKIALAIFSPLLKDTVNFLVLHYRHPFIIFTHRDTRTVHGLDLLYVKQQMIHLCTLCRGNKGHERKNRHLQVQMLISLASHPPGDPPLHHPNHRHHRYLLLLSNSSSSFERVIKSIIKS